MPKIVFSCQHHQKMPKNANCDLHTKHHFLRQTNLKKAKFLEFGFKNANLATLMQITPQHNSMKDRATPKLATATRCLIYKHSTFLRHKVIRALPNATVV